MDSFELNKIIGAILGTILLVMGVGFLAEAIYAPIEGRGVGYALPEPSGDGGHGVEVVVEEVTPLAVLLASASASDGARVARKCQSCHNFDEGGSDKTGPALFDIVGTQIAASASFGYSDTLVQMASDGGAWTYEVLNDFLEAPRAYAPGTKMTFAGLRKPEDRADLLAYLQSLSGSPVAFPEVVAEEPMMDEAHGDDQPTGDVHEADAVEPAATEEPMIEEPMVEELLVEEAVVEEVAPATDAHATDEPSADGDGDAAAATIE